eukprot:TRINITY_DN5160_c0_g1_i1.p1 TRINITY_DN5160_c0_g1~~TRINITY_DN5160_c0_g1_i1.p1  ORF type:complete len:189 (+),score=40.21 TRINITY_DN5160_c0_g1_i1:28-567(+)
MADDPRAAEIAAKVAALKAARAQKDAEAAAAAAPTAPVTGEPGLGSEATPPPPQPPTEEAPDVAKYGIHIGITCDGCAVCPVQGFRWKCRNCANHDLCDACHAKFRAGTLALDNSMLRKNKVSARLEDHAFSAYVDRDFQGLSAGSKKVAPKAHKAKPNDPCPCGSGKKHKKCCDAPAS